MLNIRRGAAYLLLVSLVMLGGGLCFAQDRRLGGTYMIPPRIFVGDRAILIVPRPGIAMQADLEISRTQIPHHPYIDIHRAALERRPGGSQLSVEFSAFAPGFLELPSFNIAGEVFSGLIVEVSSILEPGESRMVLSGLSPPLAIPGTSLLVYGSVTALVVFLLVALWTLIWGRRHMKAWLAAWKRRRLLLSMWGIEKRLKKDLTKGAGQREILDALSLEFRSFLSYFSGMNCRAMTALEFAGHSFFEEYPDAPNGEYLKVFFSRCDQIRFSGDAINGDETEALFAEIKVFLKTLDRAMRKKRPQAAPPAGVAA